MDHFAIQN